jgi:hypothetical protein
LKLHNPIADLVTVPIESHFEFGSGSRHALAYTLLDGRWYAQHAAGGPEWGVGFTVTFLFPK